MKPTNEQQDCIDLFGTANKLRINAYAGCGKTSVLEMMTKTTDREGVYLAFNKSIATEAGRRFPANVKCSTVHAMAFRSMIGRYSIDKMTGNLSGGLLATKLRLKGIALDRNTLIRPRSVGYILAETMKRWMRSDRPMVSGRDMPLEGKLETLPPDQIRELRTEFGNMAVDLWDKMTDVRSDIPLSHDGYLKAWALRNPIIPGEFVLIDEAQDTNGVVMGIIRNQRGQVIAVGDAQQAIYQWRGARNAMTELPADAEARLSTSFRFGTAIADHATLVLSLLGEDKPLKGNPARSGGLAPTAAPDAVLTRTNSRLIEELFGALEAGKLPMVNGGTQEIETFISAAEKLMAGQSVDRPPELFGFTDWTDVKLAAEDDGGQDLMRWVRLFDEHSPAKLKAAIRRLPKSEKDADFVLSTGHKSKGREWERVRICDDFLMRVRPVEDDKGRPLPGVNEDQKGELRLFYVAATRGMTQLDIAPSLTIQINQMLAANAAPAMCAA